MRPVQFDRELTDAIPMPSRAFRLRWERNTAVNEEYESKNISIPWATKEEWTFEESNIQDSSGRFAYYTYILSSLRLHIGICIFVGVRRETSNSAQSDVER